MLRNLKDLDGFNIKARDGEVGKATDFLFDDKDWGLRYVVVDTGTFFNGRKVVLPPSAFSSPDWDNQVFTVTLNREQIKDAPPIDPDKEITRDQETSLFRHYQWQPYWGTGTSGTTTSRTTESTPGTTPPTGPGVTPGTSQGMMGEGTPPTTGVPHLFSAERVRKFDVGAVDGNIGTMEDFIVDDSAWHIRYAVVDTAKFLPGKKVMVPAPVIREIRPSDSIVAVEVPRENIKNAPEYDPKAVINRKYEEILYDYYGRPRYWR